MTGGRFNPRETFDTIYLAADSITASCEVGAAIFQPGGAPIAVEHMPLVFVSIRGTVSDLLDLREPDICDALHTSDIELTNDWRYWQSLHAMGVSSIPPTQELGRAAYMCGVIRGLVFPSSKNRPHGICLAIFPDRLADGDFLEVHDPSGRLVERYP
ncbi:RES family NAD+ phosphorylase [bacterium]|nr:RES family NAD+ phosphorylase [bacterium]